jgi:serine/threonine-protein kinase
MTGPDGSNGKDALGPGTAVSGRYRIERELGRGGMATVYLARDLPHDRLVALKTLHPELSGALGTDRFLREIAIASRLQHPNILPLFDSGSTELGGGEARSFYVMPYVPGESLRARLQRETQLGLDEAIRICGQIAAALDHAHGQGIVHRDIKPENILLEGEQAVVADFGVATALDAAGGEKLTQTGISLGTPAYMSPEQATARRVDARSDVYSLACVLYEMLVGDPPFLGASPRAVMARHALDPVPSVRTARPEVPEYLEAALRRGLAKVPGDRFASAGEFAAAVAGAGPALGASAPARPLTRRIALAALGLLVAGLGTALYLGMRPLPEVRRDSNLLAVAPFDVLDPSLELWREGMGDVLSRTLDGAGPIRTVSPTVVLRRWSGRADAASAEELSRRTGAGLVLVGAVLPGGRDSVRLRASLLDQSGRPSRTDIEVTGEAFRMTELADSLGVRVLRVLSPSRPIGSVRRMSIGSRSLPGLKAFLQGEQFYRRGMWDSALTRYDQAIAADSTFALALYQMSRVLGWNPPTGGAYRPMEEYMRRATLHNHGLPARDSLLIVSDSLWIAMWERVRPRRDPDTLISLMFRSVNAIEEAARRYPEDPLPWYVLGEKRYHESWPIHEPPSAAADAFSRAIALDPGFAPPYEHMPGLMVEMGRPEEARRYATMYLALDSTSANTSSIRLAGLLLDPNKAGSVEVDRFLDTASVQTLFEAAFNTLSFWPDTAETAVRLVTRMGDPGRKAGGDAPWVLDSIMWPQFLAHALAFRGHLHQAFEVNQRLIKKPDASPWGGFVDGFLDLSLLGPLPDSLARSAFDRVLDPTIDWDANTPRHFQGLPWWLSRRDTASLARVAERAAQVARSPGPPRARLRARMLDQTSGAYLSLARGDSLEALRRLTAMPDTLCLSEEYAVNCFYHYLTLAQLLAARGDDRRASELLDFWRWSVGNTPLFVLATLELGRVSERLGDKRKAAECYGFVIAVWRRPDHELQPYVVEAREGLARLGE